MKLFNLHSSQSQMPDPLLLIAYKNSILFKRYKSSNQVFIYNDSYKHVQVMGWKWRHLIAVKAVHQFMLFLTIFTYRHKTQLNSFIKHSE